MMRSHSLKNLAVSFLILSLGPAAIAASAQDCKMDPAFFSKEKAENPKFNAERAAADYSQRCADICKDPSQCSDDDLRTGLEQLTIRVRMTEECKSLGADALMNINDFIDEKDQELIRKEHREYSQTQAPYISPDAQSIRENIKKYEYLNLITNLRLTALHGNPGLAKLNLPDLKIGRKDWKLIYTDFDVRDISLQVNQCHMVWSGMNDKPELDLEAR